VGIVEVFEVDTPASPLANISTRGQVLTGNDVMIGGFVIQGEAPQTVVVRARGPSLVPFGIANALANPVLQLFSGQTLRQQRRLGSATVWWHPGRLRTGARSVTILITLNPAPPRIVTGAMAAGRGGSSEVAQTITRSKRG
jgi:hypothetical protein